MSYWQTPWSEVAPPRCPLAKLSHVNVKARSSGRALRCAPKAVARCGVTESQLKLTSPTRVWASFVPIVRRPGKPAAHFQNSTKIPCVSRVPIVATGHHLGQRAPCHWFLVLSPR